MTTRQEIYEKYQPAVWNVGIVEADVHSVARAIRQEYLPGDDQGEISSPCSICESLESLQPLGRGDKYLLFQSNDARTAVFRNLLFGSTIQYAVRAAVKYLNRRGYEVLRMPNTIAPDQRSGVYGARRIEIWDPNNSQGEPTFHISVVNDASRWVFHRTGDPLPFEDFSGYQRRRATERFSDEKFLDYCYELGLNVFDPAWYSNSGIILRRRSVEGLATMTYDEAAVHFRLTIGCK